jgi:hypothetical protein
LQVSYSHEYDHIEGILFTDKISSLKKRLIQKEVEKYLEEKLFRIPNEIFAKRKIIRFSFTAYFQNNASQLLTTNNKNRYNEFRKILAISGKPGLFALKVQTRTGFVAESIRWKKVTVSLKSNVSLLTEISVYTYDAEKPLAEVMSNIAKRKQLKAIFIKKIMLL